MAPKTVHTKEAGRQRTYRVVPATDATGAETSTHVFEDVGDDVHAYVGEGDPLDENWSPDEDVDREDAPTSAVEAIEQFEE